MPPPIKAVVENAIKEKLEILLTTAKVTHDVYDAKFFSKFKETLGGRVRMMITGSAPIAKEVLDFLKVTFCCQIHEGFGQTEGAAASSLSFTNDPSSGHVGAPFPNCDFKLIDVPEMNYTSDDVDENGNPTPRGEMCYKGYNCFKGYFKLPENTKETLDSEGWVHTGDIGVFTPEGCIKIIDRRKNIFKLSQAEYVAPDKIEGKIAQSLYIS